MQFDGAYEMIKDAEKLKIKRSAGMYNAIMSGYFRHVISSSILN